MYRNEEYSFSGHADNSTLYTNYKFIGLDLYLVEVTNYKSTDLKIKVKTGVFSTIKTVTIKANSTDSFLIETSSETEFYLAFSAPSSFREEYIETVIIKTNSTDRVWIKVPSTTTVF